jgi:hypothetical protein
MEESPKNCLKNTINFKKLESKKFQDLDESWMLLGESFSSDESEIKNQKIQEEDFLK